MIEELFDSLMENGQTMWVSPDGTVRFEGGEDDEIPSNNEWVMQGDSFFPAKDTKVLPLLPAGCYDVVVTQGQYSVSKAHINTDELIMLPNAEIDRVLVEMPKFWAAADEFEKAGVVHKRG